MKRAHPITAILCVMLFGLVGCGPSVETVERTTDQTKLAKLAVEAKNWLVRRAAVEKLTDQALLAKLAVENKGWENRDARRAAVERLTDQALLAKLAVEDLNEDVRRAAVNKLTDQALLAKVAVQALLAKLAVEDLDEDVRRAAVNKLTDQALLAKVAVESKWLDIRVTAISKVTDQVLLRQWAEKDRQAAIRQASVRRIADDRFLIQRLPAEPSASVRAAIIEALHEQDSLRQVALTAYHQQDREHPLQRLRRVVGDQASDVATAHEALAGRVKALAAETDNGTLLALALEGEFDVLRAAAARQLSDSAALEQASLRSRDREVQKILLAKLEDKAMLNRIAVASDDRAMRLAAAQKVGAKSWQVIFNAATARGATVEMLGNALAAVSLFLAVQPEARDGVQHAALNLIRHGDESRIPEMVDLLEGYGDKTLAEDYLNCGQPDLDTAGREWAHRRGYSVSMGTGSHRATWGSGR